MATMMLNDLKAYMMDAGNDGISVWMFQGRSLTKVTERPKGIPKLNSAKVYLVLKQSHFVRVLGDQPFTSYRAYVWIGGQAQGYLANFERAMHTLNEVAHSVEQPQAAKLRLYIEYQYAESFEFFTIFEKFEIERAATAGHSGQMYSALQYLQVRTDLPPPASSQLAAASQVLGLEEAKQPLVDARSLPFPKVLILENLVHDCTPMTSFIRIYEKNSFEPLGSSENVNLMSGGLQESNLAFLYLEGRHVIKGTDRVVTDMAGDEEMIEIVTKLQLIIGGRANNKLRSFANIFSHGYKQRFPDAVLEMVELPNSEQDLPPGWKALIDQGKEEAQRVREHRDRKKLNENKKQEQQAAEDDQTEWVIAKHEVPYSLVATTHNWIKKNYGDKSTEIRNVERDPVLYRNVKITNQLSWDKPDDSMASIDPNVVNMFRVVLSPSPTHSAHAQKPENLQYLYTFALQKVKLTDIGVEKMSSHQIYIIQTPVSLYLWLGRQVDPLKKMGSLRMLQSFSKQILQEPFKYKPGYAYHATSGVQRSNQHILTIKLRIETQGYESRQILSLLGKAKQTPQNDDRVDYLMMRQPKLNEMAEEGFQEDGTDMEAHFKQNLALVQPSKSVIPGATGGRGVGSIAMGMGRKQSSVMRLTCKLSQKRGVTESALNIKAIGSILTGLKKQTTSGPSMGLDLEEKKQQANLMSKIAMIRKDQQNERMNQVRAFFDPLSMIQLSKEQNEVLQKMMKNLDRGKEMMASTKAELDFDAIWQFEISGKKFEQVEDPLKVGVFDSQKCYFVVFYRQSKVAIALWRGKDQAVIDLKASILMFKQTKFRLVKKGLRAKGVRSQSNAGEISQFMKKDTMAKMAKMASQTTAPQKPIGDAPGFVSQSTVVIKSSATSMEDSKHRPRKSEHHHSAVDMPTPSQKKIHTKYVFRPIDQVQQTADQFKLIKEQVQNMEPLKRDEHTSEINLRSLIGMDHESMFFLQGFQGSMVVTNGTYLQKDPTIYSCDAEECPGEEQYLMLFQLIGVPGFNQRAREVPPFRKSLTSSGLFVMLSKHKVLFWAGSEFFASYLLEDSFNDFKNLVSEELLLKLVYHYDQSISLTEAHNEEEAEQAAKNLDSKKILYFIEGMEGLSWLQYIAGKEPEKDERQNFQMQKFSIQRSTYKRGISRMSTKVFSKLREQMNEDSDGDPDDESEEEDIDEKGSGEDSDEDDELNPIDFDNEITSELYLPQEPKLYMVFNGKRFIDYNDEQDLTNQRDDESAEEEEEFFSIADPKAHSEYMTLKMLNNFTQDLLHAKCIFMLDFDSSVFLWIGREVPVRALATVYKYVRNALRGIHAKGKRRFDKISFHITNQGFEPEVFKRAFPSWEPFQRPGIDDDAEISEEDSSDASENLSNDEEELTRESGMLRGTSEAPSMMARVSYGGSALTDVDLSKIEKMLPGSEWIN